MAFSFSANNKKKYGNTDRIRESGFCCSCRDIMDRKSDVALLYFERSCLWVNIRRRNKHRNFNDSSFCIESKNHRSTTPPSQILTIYCKFQNEIAVETFRTAEDGIIARTSFSFSSLASIPSGYLWKIYRSEQIVFLQNSIHHLKKRLISSISTTQKLHLQSFPRYLTKYMHSASPTLRIVFTPSSLTIADKKKRKKYFSRKLHLLRNFNRISDWHVPCVRSLARASAGYGDPAPIPSKNAEKMN